jgi:hypothetical protein
MRLAAREVSIEKMRNAYEITLGNPRSKRQIGRSRLRWRVCIKVDHGENRVGPRGLD